MPKIYTKTGDNGETSLFGNRVKKYCLEIGVLGDIDELNASLGVLGVQIEQTLLRPLGYGGQRKIMKQIIDIQNNLFVVGANVAALDMKLGYIPKLNEQSITDLENWIDEMEKDLDSLHNFILPGGNSAAAQSFLARAVCRRAERKFIAFSEKYIKPRTCPAQPAGGDGIKKHLNRLSDYLFVLGRFLNKKSGSKEIVWVNK